MKLDFVGQSTRDSSNAKATTGRLVNFYREPSMAGGYVLRSVMGMVEHIELDGAWVRAMMQFGDDMLVVNGGRLYRVALDGGLIDVGAVGESVASGIAANTGYATITAGGNYWTYQTALVNVVPGALTSVGSVAYLGGYTIVSELDGRRFAWSDLADPTSMPALNFASAEINDDPIIRLATVGDALLIFKESGFETWGVTGLAGAEAFARVGGAMVEVGLSEFGLLTSYPNGLAFVSTDGRVYAWSGSQLSPVSTPSVEVALSDKNPERMFYYERRGHGFICIQFRDVPAWCYDIATGEWHERAENGGPWSASISARWDGDWYVGSDGGRISRLSTLCVDFGSPMVRVATSNTLDMDGRFNLSVVEAFARVGLDRQDDEEQRLADQDGRLAGPYGLGDSGADNTPAKLVLRTSRDGVTWGAPKPRDLGKRGNFSKRMVWRALGQFRRATVELSLSCTADVPLSSQLAIEVSR